MSEEKKTGRVSMEWPAELKEQLRALVGSRGLTDFTIQAVKTRLADRPETQDLNKELNETRWLVQRLADTIVRSGDDDDPVSRLQEVELPAWVDTTGWPEAFVRAVRIEDPTPESVEKPFHEERADRGLPPVDAPTCPKHPEVAIAPGGFCGKCGSKADTEADKNSPETESPQVTGGAAADTEGDTDEDLHRPMFMTGDKTPDLPHDQQGGSLLDRVKAKAMEKGIDINGANLKPASSLTKEEIASAYDVPPDQVDTIDPEFMDLVTPAEDPTEPASDLEVGPDAASSSTPVEEPVETDGRSDADLCPTCKSELVTGECWECM